MNRFFEWDPNTDQPRNVAPKKERFWYHFRFASGYMSLLASNIQKSIPVLSLYREYKRGMYRKPVSLDSPVGVSVSATEERLEEVLGSLKELGIGKTLVRIPSWERDRLGVYLKFIEQMKGQDFEVVISLLQRRHDVHNNEDWKNFLDEVFGRFKHMASFFEIGHAWNRTKWGVWDYREYLRLAESSVLMAKKHDTRIIGPAIIDFEFHLYPLVLKKIDFDKISSLLYVDRLGAPENTQFGWDTSRKTALLKAVVDGCLIEKRDVWITEMNWPLEGREKYSPAAGRVNVTEEDQANFLVRYFVLVLATGFVERVYWWQLAAPGYGLIDNLEKNWRRRPAFFALKCLVDRTEKAVFLKRIPHREAFIFLFCKEREFYAICWTKEGTIEYTFPYRIRRAENRDGKEIFLKGDCIQIGQSPRYVYFDGYDEYGGMTEETLRSKNRGRFED